MFLTITETLCRGCISYSSNESQIKEIVSTGYLGQGKEALIKKEGPIFNPCIHFNFTAFINYISLVRLLCTRK